MLSSFPDDIVDSDYNSDMCKYNAPRKFKAFLGHPLLAFVVLGIAQLGCSILGETTTPATLAARAPTQQPLPSKQPPAPHPGVLPTTDAPEINSSPSSPLTVKPTLTTSPTPDYFSKPIPLSQTHYIIPLSLRHVTEKSATLFFELSNPTNGYLVYRATTPGNQTQSEIPISKDQTRHMITLEGLTPGVQYQAMVILGAQEAQFQQPGYNSTAWGAVDFHTDANDNPLRVGVLGDASFGDQSTEALVALMASQDLDFVVHTGDVVYEIDSADLVNSYLVKFFQPFSPLLHQLPVYTVLGNHDYDAAVQWQGAPFYDYAFPQFFDPNFSYPASRRGNQYYAFAKQGIQFLMLDSQVFYGVEGRADQDAWLKERLQDTRFRITIPIFHVAPYSSSVVHPEDGLPIRYTWNPLFENANVPVSISGHFHHYERLSANGITYIVTGGGSSTLYAQGNLLPESHIYARRTHYVLLEIYADRIQISAISMEGDLIDQITLALQ